ncbi:SDR family oxidoreductase [Novosphingobium sp. Chol11]|uniref:SDR family oxidoreductase n=1 Tax=Novosphingobium sp. Chol11 TaxID=1385763 RepID=UPI0025D50AD1|nr:SDR family NAD(P)-dependent oxidoreductase [Novosphingobium sp. Chol11]
MMKLAGKTALITGGTDGIGLRLARQLRAKGAHVILTGRTPGRISAAQGEGFEVITAELTGPDGVDAVLAGLGARQLDILINNAGMGTTHDFREALPDPAADERILWLNIHAPIRLIVLLMPMLRARPEAMIVNVTSGLALAPSTAAAIYCATKAAMRSYTQSLRAQMKGQTKGGRIHVLEALPPVVDTAMTAHMTKAKMTPEACAAQIIAGMERNESQVNVGMVKLLAAVHAVSPAIARRFMLNF